MAPTDIETDPTQITPARPLSAEEKAILAQIEAGLVQRDPSQFYASLDPRIDPKNSSRDAAQAAVDITLQQQRQEEEILQALAMAAPAQVTVADLFPQEPVLTGKTDADIEEEFKQDQKAGLVPKDVTLEDYLNPLRSVQVEENAKIEKFNVEGRSYVLIDDKDLYVAGGRDGGQLVPEGEERDNVVKAARNPLRNVDIPDNAEIKQFTVGETKYALVNGVLYAPGERGGQQVPPEQAAQVLAARDAAAQAQQQGPQYQAPQPQAPQQTANREEAPHNPSQDQRPSNAPKQPAQSAQKPSGGLWGALLRMEDSLDAGIAGMKGMFGGKAEPTAPSPEDRQAAYEAQREQRVHDLRQHRVDGTQITADLVALKTGQDTFVAVPVTPARQQQQAQGQGRGGGGHGDR